MAIPTSIAGVAQVGRANIADPRQQPVSVSYTFDASAAFDYLLEFVVINQQQVFGTPKTIFFDNGTNPNPVLVNISITNQQLSIPPYAQGYFPITAADKSAISFVSDGGASSNLTLSVYNVDVAPSVWYTYGTSNPGVADQVEGTMAEGANVAAAADNNPVYIGGIDRGTGLFHGISVDATGELSVNLASSRAGAYTDRSLALSGASEQLMAANTSRNTLIIQNISANPMGVNIAGGAAVIGGVGTITLPAGASIVLDSYPPTNAINIIGTAADIVAAFEG